MPTKLFEEGNQLWRLRPYNAGTERLIKTPEELWQRCVDYFEWAVDNPIEEEVLGWYQGDATRETIQHVRPFTVAGLCAHAGLDRQLWAEWRKGREDLRPIIEWADQIMFEQKFSNAAAGTMNPAIVARELGLAEAMDHRSSDGSMTPKPNIIEFVAPELEPQVLLPAPSDGAEHKLDG